MKLIFFVLTGMIINLSCTELEDYPDHLQLADAVLHESFENTSKEEMLLGDWIIPDNKDYLDFCLTTDNPLSGNKALWLEESDENPAALVYYREGIKKFSLHFFDSYSEEDVSFEFGCVCSINYLTEQMSTCIGIATFFENKYYTIIDFDDDVIYSTNIERENGYTQASFIFDYQFTRISINEYEVYIKSNEPIFNYFSIGIFSGLNYEDDYFGNIYIPSKGLYIDDVDVWE